MRAVSFTPSPYSPPKPLLAGGNSLALDRRAIMLEEVPRRLPIKVRRGASSTELIASELETPAGAESMPATLARFATLLALLLFAAPGALADDAAETPTKESTEVMDLFAAEEAGQIEVKFIAKNSHKGRILVTNKLPNGVKVRLPEAFIGVPVVAQFGGGGMGGGGMGGGGMGAGGGGGQQAMGGGGGMGGGGMGGGGGMFSIPPDRVTKIDVPLLCLDHGKADPTSSNPYKLRPVDPSTDRPEVIELLKAFGNGDLQHNAAQAAVWHLNSDVSWEELATKLTGTTRNLNRSPYFNRFELQSALAYASEAARRGAELATEQSEVSKASQTETDSLPSSEEVKATEETEVSDKADDSAEVEVSEEKE
jgi:hypothetical protein